MKGTTAYCRLSGWVAGEGQCVAGVAVKEWGGIVRVDAVRGWIGRLRESCEKT